MTKKLTITLIIFFCASAYCADTDNAALNNLENMFARVFFLDTTGSYPYQNMFLNIYRIVGFVAGQLIGVCACLASRW